MSEINDLTWRHIGIIEPHAAMPTTGPEPLRSSVRHGSSCATCGEILFAYCPDDFTCEPHACPYLTERGQIPLADTRARDESLAAILTASSAARWADTS